MRGRGPEMGTPGRDQNGVAREGTRTRSARRRGRGSRRGTRGAPQRGASGEGNCPTGPGVPVARTVSVTHRQVHAHFGTVEQEDAAVEGGLGGSGGRDVHGRAAREQGPAAGREHAAPGCGGQRGDSGGRAPPRAPVALVPQPGGPAPCRAPRVALHGAAAKGPAQKPQHPGWGRPLPPPPAPLPLRRRPGVPRDAVSASARPRLLPPAAARGSLPPRPRPRSGCLRGAPAGPAPTASGRGREGALGAARQPSRRRLRRHALCRAGGLRSRPRSRCRRPAAGGPGGCGGRGGGLPAAPAPRAGRGPAGAGRLRAPGALAPTRRAPDRGGPAEYPLPRRLFLRPQPPPPTWEAAPPAAAAAATAAAAAGTAARPPPSGLRRVFANRVCAAPCRPERPLLL